MKLHELHHCSIRTDKLEETQEFFVKALGMEIGDRPDFPFPGYWLYAEGKPIVHLVGVDPNDSSGLVKYLGDAALDGPTGPFDHMAFNISGPVSLRKHLKKNNIPFREREVPNMGLLQFFLEDPNGVIVELNCWVNSLAPEIAPQVSNRDHILGIAQDMVSDLEDRAAKAEKIRRIPRETIKTLDETGVMGVLKPARIGGAELDYATILEVSYELSRGCGSTGWVYVNIASHHWMLAMFPEQAQKDVWDTNPFSCVASSVIYPAGKAKRVKGGYELSGRWPFCSGILHSDWIMVGGLVGKPSNSAPPEGRIFVISKNDLELIDTWNVGGLVATGSFDVEVEKVFVPAHRTLASADIRGGPTPGSIINPNPLYQLPVAALFPHLVAAPVIGMARGIVDRACESMQSRTSTYNRGQVSSYVVPQLRVSNALAAQDMGMALILANCHEADGVSINGKNWNVEDKHRWRRDAAYVSHHAVQATDQVHQAQGGASVYKGNPIERMFRDMHAGLGHIGISNDVNGVAFGRLAMGLKPDNPNI